MMNSSNYSSRDCKCGDRRCRARTFWDYDESVEESDYFLSGSDSEYTYSSPSSDYGYDSRVAGTSAESDGEGQHPYSEGVEANERKPRSRDRAVVPYRPRTQGGSSADATADVEPSISELCKALYSPRTPRTAEEGARFTAIEPRILSARDRRASKAVRKGRRADKGQSADGPPESYLRRHLKFSWNLFGRFPGGKQYSFWDSNRGRRNHHNREPKYIGAIRRHGDAERMVEQHRASAAAAYRTYYVLEKNVQPYFESNRGCGVLSWNSEQSGISGWALDEMWEKTLKYVLTKREIVGQVRVLGCVLDKRSSRVFVDLWVDSSSDSRGVETVRREWSNATGVPSAALGFAAVDDYIECGKGVDVKCLPRVYESPSKMKEAKKKAKKNEGRKLLRFPLYRARVDESWESIELE